MSLSLCMLGGNYWLICMCSQASLDIEDCENKVEGVGQQELSMQGVCLCVVTLKSIML